MERLQSAVVYVTIQGADADAEEVCCFCAGEPSFYHVSHLDTR